MGMKGSNSVTE